MGEPALEPGYFFRYSRHDCGETHVQHVRGRREEAATQGQQLIREDAKQLGVIRHVRVEAQSWLSFSYGLLTAQFQLVSSHG
jgi:hypothetical protein